MSELVDLTEKEREVLGLICEGHTTKEIAGILGIAEGTVKLHTSRVITKHKAKNRTHLAALVWRGRLEQQNAASP